ncbi:hypothetical protein MWN34_03390 [Ancylobacter sp. 6x-1]|uniref:Uncharacterized protein n=1 Tax=Ancylobacter crimeensis TaxID=2579147 RepID=A0ABT0D7P9_9HYPH|nr:hypothetical protein [Ancylobacter crimeensis]MCK0195949.1 hypothetical protein [Ancylobacter crimeensis]
MDTPTRKAIELLLEVAEERRIHETEDDDNELAGRLAAAIEQVRGLIGVMGDAAS